VRLQSCEKQLSASSRLSVRPHGTTLFSLNGFSLNLKLEYFSKICWKKSKFHFKLTRIASTLLEDRYAFLIISGSVLLIMRNILDRSCNENQNTVCVQIFFSKIVPFAIYCAKCCVPRQATAGYLRLQTHTQNMQYAAVVARTRLNVTLHVHCLSCC
jgi:hypothetical protein